MAANDDASAAEQPTAKAFLRVQGKALGMVEVRPVADGGVFVPHPSPGLPKGSAVVLSFPLPGGQQHDMHGAVVHVITKDHARRTMTEAGYVLALAVAAAATPANEPAAPQRPTLVPKPIDDATTPAPAARPKVVLVIEDDRTLGKLIECWLTKIGVETIGVTTGKAALEKARNPQVVIDLAIVDSLLPDTSGAQLIPRLLKLRKVPVIATSGIMTKADARTEIMRAGATRFFSKPLAEQAIGAAVTQLTTGASRRESPPDGTLDPRLLRSA